jgi:hypothetical protein
MTTTRCRPTACRLIRPRPSCSAFVISLVGRAASKSSMSRSGGAFLTQLRRPAGQSVKSRHPSAGRPSCVGVQEGLHPWPVAGQREAFELGLMDSVRPLGAIAASRLALRAGTRRYLGNFKDVSSSTNEGPDNNKMQRTSHGQNGGSPLILVFGGPGEGVRRAHGTWYCPPRRSWPVR